MVDLVTTLCEVVGLLLVAVGVAFVFVPAGLIVLGVELVASAVFTARARAPRGVR